MDLENAASAQEAVSSVQNRALNSSFVATYYPDVIMKPFKNESTEVVVPPSVVVLGAISLNDSLGYPWFAPAGVTRGLLKTTIKPVVGLVEPEIDLLYKHGINPLYSSTNIKGSNLYQNVSGVVVWGQKTMQRSHLALDRINVRRLLIEIRRNIKDIARRLLFEPNRQETLARFNSSATDSLNAILALDGMDSYNIKIDSSTTTQNDVENNTIRGRIYVRPKKTNEFVSLEFSVSNTQPDN
jgi:phage tail sheath protein FI